MNSSESNIGHSFQLAISILTAGIIMIFRPYKRNKHNFVEFIIFLVLAAMAGDYIVFKDAYELDASIYKLHDE